jgi:hypothetical protein
MRTKGEPSWVQVVSCSIRPDTAVWERAAGTGNKGKASRDASRKRSALLTTTRTPTRLGSCSPQKRGGVKRSIGLATVAVSMLLAFAADARSAHANVADPPRPGAFGLVPTMVEA